MKDNFIGLISKATASIMAQRTTGLIGFDCRGPEQKLSLTALPTLAPQSRNSKRRCPGQISGDGCSSRLRGGVEFAERRAKFEFNFPTGLESALEQLGGASPGCVGAYQVLE